MTNRPFKVQKSKNKDTTLNKIKGWVLRPCVEGNTSPGVLPSPLSRRTSVRCGSKRSSLPSDNSESTVVPSSVTQLPLRSVNKGVVTFNLLLGP